MTNSLLTAIPVATILVVILAIAGAVVVIAYPSTLSFGQYVKDIGLSAGILGIGRGLDSLTRP